MLILALRAAKYSTWSACDKSFGTMPAKLDRVFAVCQHKTEHHLYAQQQGMKIPNDGRLMTTWGAFIMIIRSKLNDTYIFHYLNSQMFFSQVFKDTGTATINQITKGILNECKLPIPPETARKQISKMLSSFDVKIQNAEISLSELAKYFVSTPLDTTKS